MSNHIVTKSADVRFNFTNLDYFPLISTGIGNDGRRCFELRTYGPSGKKDFSPVEDVIMTIYEGSPSYDSIKKYLERDKIAAVYLASGEILK